jgi:hypothetical protein
MPHPIRDSALAISFCAFCPPTISLLPQGRWTALFVLLLAMMGCGAEAVVAYISAVPGP